MSIERILLRCSLVGLAIIFSAGVGAAGLSCSASREGYRCEAWPQGAQYRYEWHLAANVAAAGDDLAVAHRKLRCPTGHAAAIAVSVIAPAGYVETATHWLPACPDVVEGEATDHALASSF